MCRLFKIRKHKMNLIKLWINNMVTRKMKKYIRQIHIIRINLKLYLVGKLQKRFRIKTNQIYLDPKLCIKREEALMRNTISWVHLEMAMESNFIILGHLRKDAVIWWKWWKIVRSQQNNKVQQFMSLENEIILAIMVENTWETLLMFHLLILSIIQDLRKLKTNLL